MANIREVSNINPIARIALDMIDEYAPAVSRDAEFYKEAGPTAYYKEQPEPNNNHGFRDKDNTPDRTAGNRSYNSEAKKIFSISAEVDIVLEQRNMDVMEELEIETEIESAAAAKTLQEKLFEGSVASDPLEFDGLKAKTPDSNIETLGTDGMVLTLGNSDTHRQQQQKAAEELLNFISKYNLTHVYMNEKMKNRWVIVLKEIGYYRQQKDNLGDPMDTILGTPIRSAGRDANGDFLLPFNETVGGSNNCSRIIGARWGKTKQDLYFSTSAGIYGEYMGRVGKAYVNDVDLDSVLVLQNDDALASQKGWRLE